MRKVLQRACWPQPKADSLLPRKQALWSAAACCRFDPASLLAASPAQAPRTGQQAGLRESGSKLPHSRTLRPPSRTVTLQVSKISTLKGRRVSAFG